jgi:hypothetical protein
VEVEGRNQAVEEVPGERIGESVAGGSAMEQPQRQPRRIAVNSVLDSRRFLITIDAAIS